VFLWLHNYETKCCCVRDKVLISLSFSSSTYVFPFSSSPLLCVFGSILSRVSVLTGSQGGKLKNPHLHLYLHITSLTDCRLFAYLANFMNAGSRIGAIELWCPVFRVYILHQNFSDLQFDPRLLELASLPLPTMTLSD
jgi:hypothetical protein